MVVMAAYPQHTLNVDSEDVASPGGTIKKTDLQQHLQVCLCLDFLNTRIHFIVFRFFCSLCLHCFHKTMS